MAFPDNISRPVFYLLRNTPDVFGYDAHTKHRKAVKHRDENHRGGPPLYWKAKKAVVGKELAVDEQEGENEGNHKNGQTQQRDHSDGERRTGEKGIEGQADLFAEGPAGFALCGRPVVAEKIRIKAQSQYFYHGGGMYRVDAGIDQVDDFAVGKKAIGASGRKINF